MAEGPEQVNSRWTGASQALYGRLDGAAEFVGWLGNRKAGAEGDTVSGGDADSGCAADDEPLYGVGNRLDVATLEVDDGLRQFRLIEKDESRTVSPGGIFPGEGLERHGQDTSIPPAVTATPGSFKATLLASPHRRSNP